MSPETTPLAPTPSPTALEKLPDFPLTKWNHIKVEDLGDKKERCPCCRRQTFRYGHILEHPDWPDPIRVGCVCACKLTTDSVIPKARLKAAMARSNRLLRFLDNGWEVDRPGGYIRKYKWDRVLVRPFSWGYIYQINYGDFSDTVKTLQLAKVGAFEELDRRTG